MFGRGPNELARFLGLRTAHRPCKLITITRELNYLPVMQFRLTPINHIVLIFVWKSNERLIKNEVFTTQVEIHGDQVSESEMMLTTERMTQSI